MLKPLSSAISIGTGGPFGAEGPIIMTGGAIGSLFAQFFHLTAAERKTLLVAGAAAGMAAIFATPVAAVLLAVELLLFEWKPRSFIPVAVAAGRRGGVRGRCCRRRAAVSRVAAMPTCRGGDCWLCVGVGMVAGLQSGLLTTLLYGSRTCFERLPIHWMWWPAIGGLVVGLGGLIDPRALGVGYDIIGDLLRGASRRRRRAARCCWSRPLIWVVALASGTSGGVLAPLLIIGGALGWLVGRCPARRHRRCGRWSAWRR